MPKAAPVKMAAKARAAVFDDSDSSDNEMYMKASPSGMMMGNQCSEEDGCSDDSGLAYGTKMKARKAVDSSKLKKKAMKRIASPPKGLFGADSYDEEEEF